MKNKKIYNRGSEWRKWDLHFHTPSSSDYKDKSVNDQDIVDGLIKNKIKVVAITDHNTIDVDRISKLKKLAGDNITILPAIEIRTGAGTGENIHLIGIFSEDSDCEAIKRDFLSKGELDSQRKNGKQEEELFVNLDKAIEIIKTHDGLISIHAGKKSNGIDKITNAMPVTRATKEEIVKKVDILEMGQITDFADYEKNVFPNIGLKRPMIICSDNHNINNYKPKTNLWIKADPTFEGLKQALIEDDNRIYVGDTPSEINYFQENKIKYIKSISISPIDGVLENVGWFNSTIEFNAGLVAVIGNKGSGKSALADIIGLMGNAKTSQYFSFLNSQRFIHKKTGKAKDFRANITWHDGDKRDEKLLSDGIDNEALEEVKYIPQRYIEELCNEKKNEEFQSELQKVIFYRISKADRLNTNSFEDLIALKIEAIKKQNEVYVSKVKDLNKKIIEAEKNLLSAYMDELDKKLKEKRKDLENLVKPKDVKKPEGLSEDQETIKNEIKILEKFKGCQKKIEIQDNDIAKKVNSLNQFLIEIHTIEMNYNRLIQSYDFTNYDIQIKDVIKLTSNKTIVEGKIKSLNEIIIKNVNLKGKIETKIEETKEVITEKIKKLDAPNKEYQTFESAKKKYEESVEKINGDEEYPDLDTINYLMKRISYVKKELPHIRDDLLSNRKEALRDLLKGVENIKNTYSNLFEPLKSITEKDIAKKLKLSFSSNINPTNFIDGFNEFISKSVSGNFIGDKGSALLEDAIQSFDFNDLEGCVKFIDHIELNLRNKGEFDEKQLRKNSVKQDLYDFLWTCPYLQPAYSLTLNGKDLKVLSPGERGIVLLVFYLLLDPSNRPIIIDQPEENLDNNTVAEVLVPIIKDAKKHRQIFMVTHNPNIAVVCDAEQIIHAQIDKNDQNAITYTGGSIENAEINKLISDVLEGTIKAFDNRNSKYYVNRK